MQSFTIPTRQKAGRLLGLRLKHLKISNPITIAISPQAIPIAFEVARILNSPLELEISEKIMHPRNAELVIGVATEEDFFLMEPDFNKTLDLHPTDLENILISEARKIQKKSHLYKKSDSSSSIFDRNVILVDEKSITGSTARAAIETARIRGALQVHLALALCVDKIKKTIEIESSPDTMIILSILRREQITDVPWPPVTEDEVIALLKKSKQPSFIGRNKREAA